MVTSMPIRRAVGVLGRPERAEVDERGAVYATDCTWRLDWWIGDGDRWRDPSVDPSVRHRAVDSTPVFEAAVRITAGDVRQRVFGAVDAGVVAAIEVENDSSLPVAIAFAMHGEGPMLLSARGATAVPLPEATDGPPADATVFPLPHHAVLRVALPLTPGIGDWPARLPTSVQVAAGWRAVDERGERIEAPGALPGQFALARAQLLLAVHDDPATELLATAARWRLSNESSDLLPARDAGRAAQLVADRARRQPTALDRAALVDARVMLDAVGDRRAAADIDRVVDRLDDVLSGFDDDVAFVASTRQMLARDSSEPRTIALLSDLAPEWSHADLAAHRIPTRWGEVSFAVRWHGARPAILWECEQSVTIRVPSLDPAWSSQAARGEALLSGISST
jgi:hypothetical protein